VTLPTVLPSVQLDTEAAAAVFDWLDIESTGFLRAHELAAFTSLLDTTPEATAQIGIARNCFSLADIHGLSMAMHITI